MHTEFRLSEWRSKLQLHFQWLYLCLWLCLCFRGWCMCWYVATSMLFSTFVPKNIPSISSNSRNLWVCRSKKPQRIKSSYQMIADVCYQTLLTNLMFRNLKKSAQKYQFCRWIRLQFNFKIKYWHFRYHNFLNCKL